MTKKSFQQMRYIVIRKAVSSDLACFVYNYFLMKRQVAETMRNAQYIPPSTTDWGTWHPKYRSLGPYSTTVLRNRTRERKTLPVELIKELFP